MLIASNLKLPYWHTTAAGTKKAAGELQVKYEVVGPETYDPKAQHKNFQRLLNVPVR